MEKRTVILVGTLGSHFRSIRVRERKRKTCLKTRSIGLHSWGWKGVREKTLT